MKIIVFSDLHIHNYKKFDIDGSRLDNCLDVLYKIFKYADESNVKHIFFGGDLYDQQKSLPTIVVNRTIQTFIELFDFYPDIKFYAISGNHDHGSKNIDGNVIDSLVHLDYLFPQFILFNGSSFALDDCIFHGIPYYSHSRDFKKALSDINTDEYRGNYLVIHQTPKHSNEMIPHECDPEDFLDFDFTFCGHIHKHELLTDKMVIIGSPLHRDLGDEGLDKGFIVFDTDTNTFERQYLDYPKFERAKIGEQTSEENYVIPVVEEVHEIPQDFSLNKSREDLLINYVTTIDKKNFLEVGKILLND